MRIVPMLLGAATLVVAAPALACGMALHLWMAERGVERVRAPDLKKLLQKYRNEWRSGSSYPDAGYAPSFFKEPKYHWGEESHWAPFQIAYLDYIKQKCAGRYATDKHCGRLVSHFMGTVAHGLQDQTFDELFVSKVQEMDGGGQEITDTGLDMIALVRHPSRLKAMPLPYYAPAADLEKVYRDTLKFTPAQANAKQIRRAALIMQAGHVGERFAALPTFRKHEKKMPWGSKHYRSYPGGVEWSGAATARLWEYYWDRLNGREGFAPDRLSTVPVAGATDVPIDRLKTESKVTVVFDRPIIPASVNAQTFYVQDAAGQKLAGHHRFIYVGAGKTHAEGHVAAFYPAQALKYGATYKVVLTNGILDDRQKPVLDSAGHNFSFRTATESPYRTIRIGGFCLEAESGVRDAAVKLAACNGTDAQQWLRDAERRLHPRIQENRCLDAIGKLTSVFTKGTKVVLYDCSGRRSQRFVDGAKGSLRSAVFNKLALDASPLRPGTRPQLRLYKGNDAQRWELSKELGAPVVASPAPAAAESRRHIEFGHAIKKPADLPPR